MFIGIDVGGTHIRIGRFTNLHASSHTDSIDLPTKNDYQKDLQGIITSIKSFSPNPHGIGIGVPGIIDRKTFKVQNLPNIGDWNGANLLKDLQTHFECQIIIENDAVCGALSQALSDSDLSSFWYITWGTGVGGAYAKQIENKVRCFPSEFGHQILDWHNLELKDMESLTGGTDISLLYKKKPNELSVEDWRIVEKSFAHGIINLLYVHYTNTIVFGGGVSFKQKSEVQNIMNSVERHFNLFPSPKLIFAHHKENAGMIGAMELLKSDLYSVEVDY